MPAGDRARWQEQLDRGRNQSPEIKQRQGRMWRSLLTLTAGLAKAHVPLMAGTDVGNPFVYPGSSLHDELVLLAQAGLTPGEALRTATYSPAKFLGLLDRLGTVEKGKLADLVLLDANPLEDIANTRRIRAVVLNGRYLDRKALDKLLADASAMAANR